MALSGSQQGKRQLYTDKEEERARSQLAKTLPRCSWGDKYAMQSVSRPCWQRTANNTPSSSAHSAVMNEQIVARVRVSATGNESRWGRKQVGSCGVQLESWRVVFVLWS